MSASQILVVEDEGIVATAIKTELEQFGYAVPDVAASADEAVEKALRKKPDLVLMDIRLKGDKDGIEAAREIHDRCGIPVVYLSAFGDSATVARARETEAFGYLLKPYEERELQTTVEMALAKHRAERKLAETELWLAATLEGIDDAVIATDLENQVHIMNLAGEALTGWRIEDVVGNPVDAVCNLSEGGERIKLDDLAERAIRESRTVTLPATTRLVTRSGLEIPVEGSLSPIYDSRGGFLGMALTLRDISVRLELEQVRHQNEEQSRQAQKMEAVCRLAGGIALHLSDLLMVILGKTTLALMRPFYEEPIAQALGHVEAAGQRAAELLQRLMVFSGVGHGQFGEVDIDALLHGCIEENKPLPDARIDVECSVDPYLWTANADAVPLSQAILNLFLNAQDAMPDGGQLTLQGKNIRLTKEEVVEHPGGRLGEFVRIRVGDTGKGITPEVRARLFEPFFTTKEPGQRIGLGLAFAFAVIEQHHGWIECKSELGRGTRFDVYLPRHGDGIAQNLTRIEERKPRGARPIVLVADADPLVRDFGRRILEDEGYQVLVADDGVQAVEIFQQAPDRIDLAIVDLNIPRLTGDSILSRLSELDPNIAVIFSSGYIAEDRPQSQSGNNLLGVINKPYHRDELLSMVHKALARFTE